MSRRPAALPPAPPVGLPLGIGRNEIIFSLKAFAAAVLALWIALVLDLPKPYWAMATAYIVIQPLAAAVTSKAVFRVLGTLLGATAAVVLVPNLVDAPELLCLALAAWVGLCLFISLLDRTPRSYVAMLAGYSAAIIAFSSVSEPLAVFDIALARTEEITIGIVCAALVSRLVAPRHLGPLLTARLDGWLADAGRWAGDVLCSRPEPQTTARDRQRLASDTVEMLALTTHLPYDTSELRHVAGRVGELQQRMTALLPLLSSLDDRLRALRAEEALDPRIEALVTAVGGWIDEGTRPGIRPGPALREEADRLRRQVDDLAATLRAGDGPWSWRGLLAAALLQRLGELVEVWADCQALRADIRDGRARPRRRRVAIARSGGDAPLHVDVPLAGLAGLAVGLTILLCCAFWIATGWSAGSGAAQMAAIFFCLFAFMDNPVPVMRRFALYTFIAILAVGLFQFALLPLADSFVELVLLMAPFLLVCGALMATPKHGAFGFLMCVNLPLVTLLDARLHLDVASYVNANTASMAGILAATTIAASLTAVGAERSIARLLRANSRDLARIAEGRAGRDPAALVRRLVDRFGLLVQRLVAASTGEARARPAPEQVLVDLRVGLNMADLQRLRPQLPVDGRAAIEALLPQLARHFHARDRGNGGGDVSHLAARIDAAIARLAEGRDAPPATRTALNALVGLRRGLLPDAPEPRPEAPSSVDWSLAS